MICPLACLKSRKPPATRAELPAAPNRTKPTYPLDRNELWSPITAGPYIVPISRWIE